MVAVFLAPLPNIRSFLNGNFSSAMLILIYLDMILSALIISLISFQSFYYFEKSTYDFKHKHEDYKKFRRMLSLLVAISFLISTAYWINPYSNPLN